MPYLGGAVAANVNDDDALDERLHANVALRHGGASPLRVVKCVRRIERANANRGTRIRASERAKRREGAKGAREETDERASRAVSQNSSRSARDASERAVDQGASGGDSQSIARTRAARRKV
jgi:hypothetical protein